MKNPAINKILEDGFLLVSQGLFSRGIELFKKKRFLIYLSLKTRNQKNNYFLLYGSLLAFTGSFKKAVIYLKKSLNSPYLKKAEIYFILLYCYINLGNNKKIKYFFNKIVNLSYSPFFILLSYYYCIKNDIPLNINLKSLESIVPEEFEDVYDILAEVIYFLLKDQTEEAYKLISENKKNNNILFYFNLVFLKVLFNSKRYDEIIETFNNNSEYLSSIELLNIFACSLYKLELFDECSKVLNNILYIQKNYSKALINLGKISLIKKNYTTAIELFNNALKDNKRFSNAVYFYLSIAYQQLGLLNNMLNCTNNISEKSTYYHMAYFNLSLLYYDLGKFRESIETIKFVDIDVIGKKKYYYWKDIINNANSDNKHHVLRWVIIILPWIILFFSISLFIILYFFIR